MGLKHNEPLKKAFVEHYSHTGNISKTCQDFSIGRDTVYRLMKSEPEFKNSLDEARTQFLSNMADNFKEHAPEALECLLSVIRDSNAPATAKVQASTRIIDYSKDFSEAVEMEERIKGLQRDIAEAEREVI